MSTQVPARKYEVLHWYWENPRRYDRFEVSDAMGEGEKDKDSTHYRAPIATFHVNKTHGHVEQFALANKLCDYLNQCREATEMATKLLMF